MLLTLSGVGVLERNGHSVWPPQFSPIGFYPAYPVFDEAFARRTLLRPLDDGF